LEPSPIQTYFFELLDLYEKKNMPKVVYMVHALAYAVLHTRIPPPHDTASNRVACTCV